MTSESKQSPIVLLFLLLAVAVPLIQACTVCGNCLSCTPDVLTDTYIDDIDALLQSKIQDIGFPVAIKRNANPSTITYNVQYSNGLNITLSLTLSSMQIQLISYAVDSSYHYQTAQKTSQTQTTKTQTSSDSDGYSVISNFGSNSTVTALSGFVSKVAKGGISNFKLVGAQVTSSPVVVYRLQYQVLSVASQSNLIENVYIQYLNGNQYKFLESNYSVSTNGISWTKMSPMSMQTDQWLINIHSILINEYNNLIGNSPKIIGVALSPPFYQLQYQVNDSNYTFFVIYDYLQSRII